MSLNISSAKLRLGNITLEGSQDIFTVSDSSDTLLTLSAGDSTPAPSSTQ